MSEFATMKRKIQKAAGDRIKLSRCNLSLDRLYAAGIFTVSEFKRLDDMILSRIIKLDRETSRETSRET